MRVTKEAQHRVRSDQSWCFAVPRGPSASPVPWTVYHHRFAKPQGVSATALPLVFLSCFALSLAGRAHAENAVAFDLSLEEEPVSMVMLSEDVLVESLQTEAQTESQDNDTDSEKGEVLPTEAQERPHLSLRDLKAIARLDPQETEPQDPSFEIDRSQPPAFPDPGVETPIRGLIFLQNETKINVEGLEAKTPLLQGGKAAHIDISDVGFLSQAFQNTLAPYIGQEMTMATLQEILEDTVSAARAAGRPVVDVYLPEQDITSGVIQIMVQVGRLGKVIVEGNEHFSSDLLESQIRLTSGAPIEEAVLDEDLDWLNRNPFRRVDIVYAQGEEEGTTDITLRTEDRFPVRVVGNINNMGTKDTGRTRLLGGVTWGNAFGMDHQFDYLYSRARDADIYEAHHISYSLPVFDRDTLSFSAAFISINVEQADGLVNLAGEGTQFLIRYKTDLPSFQAFPDLSHELGFGFDYKQASADLAFGGVSVYETAPEIVQGLVSYTVNAPDEWGDNYAHIELIASPGELRKDNDDTVFSSVRPGTRARYIYGRGRLERSFNLPGDVVFSAHAEAQWSSQRLIPGEAIAFGGQNSIKGYAESAFIGDRGYRVGFEISSPPFSILDDTVGTDWGDQAQIYGFYDWGKVNNINPSAFEKTVGVLSSLGWGVRYQIAPYVSADISYAIPLRPLSTVTGQQTNKESRIHFSLSVGY